MCVVQHLSHADHVLVLDKGSITQQGTFNEIRLRGYDLAHLVASRKDPESTKENETTPATHAAPVAAKEKKVDDTEDDETAEQYTGGGVTPYMFYFRAAGKQRTVVFLVSDGPHLVFPSTCSSNDTKCLVVVMSVVRLGDQVNNSVGHLFTTQCPLIGFLERVV